MKIIDFKKYTDDFIWDYKLHFPIPTLNYIMKQTGLQMLNRFDTREIAEGNIKSMCRSSKNFLFGDRLDMLEQEYYMATNVDRIYEILEFVMEFINFAFITGDYVDYFKPSSRDTRYNALTIAKNNVVGARLVNLYRVNFREGY